MLLGEGEGEWEKSFWVEEWKRFQGVFNKEYGIPVPPGEHAIKVVNDGADWMEITMFKFENCGVQTAQLLKVFGFKKSKNIFLWVRNSNYIWSQVKHAGMPRSIRNAIIKIPGIEKGSYKVEWWDTYWDGKFEEVFNKVGQDKILELKVPSMHKDAACKIIKQ